VLLDLDGTLTDSAPVIRDGVRRALVSLGLPAPDDSALAGLVGPGLSSGLTDAGVPAELIGTVIARYRQWYREVGIPATPVFDGIDGALQQLREAGCTMAVATSKPEPLARQVTALTGLDRWLTGVYGAPPDEVPSTKADVIAHALTDLGPDLVPGADRTVMVGDRVHDVIGAGAHGLRCLLVGWGAAPEGELAQAAPWGVVGSVDGLAAAVLAAVAPAGGGR
jgi:phosphoglycolate phosphatase